MTIPMLYERESLQVFQSELINLAVAMVGSSAARFWLMEPEENEQGLTSYNIDHCTEDAYQNKYCEFDPMHPSRFENEEIDVICSDTLMSENEWKQSNFYREFMAPRYYDHDVDVFFRREGKIVAVLSILRDDSIGPFKESELALLRKLHPFLQFTFNSLYRPQWQEQRKHITQKYLLTCREMEVTEIAMAGANTKTIARELNLSIATVKTHLQHIFEKVGVHSTKELISILFRDVQQDSFGQHSLFHPNG